MFTIFATPKRFQGHFGVIQKNAITSWTLLRPRPQILLMGRDEGTAETAAALGVQHVPDVACNEFGTPILGDMFRRAETLAEHRLLCYVNADIILMSDLMPAVSEAEETLPQFLLFSQRWDVDLAHPHDFRAGWEVQLRRLALDSCPSEGLWGLADYFVFPQGALGEIPPFAIGRTAFDNWLIYRARMRGVPVVDATGAVMVVHQKHDYSHHPQSAAGVWRGPEARQNQALAGGTAFNEFGLYDATHLLGPKGLVKARGWKYLNRRLEAAALLDSRFAALGWYRPAHRLLTRAYRRAHGALARGR